MDKYIVLDIESPNTYFNSVSAIGIIVIENNTIVDKIYSLINPEDEFDEDIIELTGITPEMVKDQPKFNEFWPSIEELLITNVIVGHNIEYDLTVISNSLNNYNLFVPDFKYVCTYELSRSRLEYDSYKLPDIMDELNVDYDAHNALADAEVTHFLYNYLDKIRPVATINLKTFHNADNDDILEEIIPHINELYGMIRDFICKDEITTNQIDLFRHWIDENMEYSSYKKINYIILRLNTFINKKDLNKEDKINISTLVNCITSSDKYSNEEINYQVLLGILKMYHCDEHNNEDETNFLKRWLTYYTIPKNVSIDSYDIK